MITLELGAKTIILISGFARSGKDAMTQGFIQALAKRGILARRYAFADELKKQLDPLLRLNHGISAFTEDPVDKALIRPILLSYGQMCRKIDQDYWVKTVAKAIKDFGRPHISIISDCRYTSEVQYFSGDKFLLHITRLDDNGNEFPPVGDDEAFYGPQLKDMADAKFTWENCGDNKQTLYYKAEELLVSLFDHKFTEWTQTYPL